jgi:transposase
LNKKQRQTNRYQEYIYEKVREGVEEVCVDMWGGFPKVIREVFPNAKIVIDRFHV